MESVNTAYESFSDWRAQMASTKGRYDYGEDKYDIMDEKDASCTDSYDTQISLLSQGEIEQNDTDKDGVLSYFEFAYEKAKDENPDGTNFNQPNYSVLGYAIDRYLGDEDGSISQEELEEFYKNADSYHYGTEDEKDGVLEYGQMNFYSFDLTTDFLKDVDDDTAMEIYKMMKDVSSKVEEE